MRIKGKRCAIKGQAGSAWRRTARVGGDLCVALQEGIIRMSRTERVEAHSWLAWQGGDNPGGKQDHTELPSLATYPGCSPATPHSCRCAPRRKDTLPVGIAAMVLPSTAQATRYCSCWALPPSFRELRTPQTSRGSWEVNVTVINAGSSARGASPQHP